MFSGKKKRLNVLHLHKFRGPSCYTQNFGPLKTIVLSSMIFNCSFHSIFLHFYENIQVTSGVTFIIFIGQSYFDKLSIWGLNCDNWSRSCHSYRYIIKTNFWEPRLKMSLFIKGMLRSIFCIDVNIHSDKKWKIM